MDLDPYAADFQDDPYPVYAELRDRYPVHHNPTRDFWSVARHADVLSGLHQPHVFSSAAGISLEQRSQSYAEAPQTPMMILMDPPQHDALRSLVNRSFTPRRILELEPRVRAIAREHAQQLVGRASSDFWADLAAPLPTTVIAELLGVPVSDREMFKEKSTQVVSSTSPGAGPSADDHPTVELGAYLFEQFQHKRRHPSDDLMSALLAAEVEGRRLTDPELIGFAVLLLIAGNETTTNLLCNALMALDRHPDQRRRLRERPELIPSAIEEVLRFDSPVQTIGRTLLAPVEIGGQKIPEGALVFLLLASANRDPRHWKDPDRFDIERRPNRHLAFGFGTHFCLGASLARLEARVALEELFSLLPDFHVSGPAERLRSVNIRGLLSLPLEFERAA